MSSRTLSDRLAAIRQRIPTAPPQRTDLDHALRLGSGENRFDGCLPERVHGLDIGWIGRFTRYEGHGIAVAVVRARLEAEFTQLLG